MAITMSTKRASAMEPTERTTQSVIEIRDLSVSLKRGHQRIGALRDVSLSVKRGEVVALVGESGSGKSVLGMTILGLLPDSATPLVEGSVSVLGTDVIGASQQELRGLRKSQLGAVFQDPMSSLNPSMKIRDQLLEVSRQLDQVEKALEDVGITDVASTLERFPFELSGGQRQRVMIAMALLKEPALVVADEPTTALDVTIQAQFLELIKHLRKTSQSAFLFITHDLGVAAEVADRIVVLYNGKILEEGPAKEILSRPSHPYSRHLMSSRITMRQDRSKLMHVQAFGAPSAGNPISCCPWVQRCEYATTVCGEEFPGFAEVGPQHVTFCHNLASLTPWDEMDLLMSPGSKRSRTTLGQVVLDVAGLEKRFRVKTAKGSADLHAIANVDLKLHRGEVTAVVGESGSGKSTLLRLLAGLEKENSGSIDRKGGPMPNMVFQDAGSSLTPWMSVSDLLSESLRSRKLSRLEVRVRVEKVLAEVGLDSALMSTKAQSLSGGQRQRVAIARCVIDPPSVLLCDEPTSALDASLVASTLNLLVNLKDEHEMGMVFVTHDLAVARYIADRVLVMYKGRIVESGPSAALCDEPLHPYTRMLLRSLPGEGQSGEPGRTLTNIDYQGIGCAFAARWSHAMEKCVDSRPVPIYLDGRRQVSCHLVKDAIS